MKSPQQWFIQEDGREVGPLTPSELRDLVRAGRITRDTPVRPAPRPTFVAAGTVSGLIPPEPAPPPVPAEELFETGHPRHEVQPLPDTFQLDPAAKAEDLFENHTPVPRPAPVPVIAEAGPSVAAAALFEETVPRPTPRRLGPAPMPMLAPAKSAKPAKLPEVAYLLEAPSWKNLWPLAALILVLGWIVGGYFSFERMYGPGSTLPVLILALGGVPVALAAIIHYLRPQRIPVVTAIFIALFTAVIGIILLLALQSLAEAAAHTRQARMGRGSFIWAILAAIGSAYDAINSPNVISRWLGFVFGVGLCEEATKLLPLAALVIWRGDRRFSVHTFLFLGFVSGLGFGIGEAIYGYAPWSGVYGVDDNVIRWYSAVPSHAVYTTVCAAFLWKLADHLEHAEGFWERAGVIAMAVGVMAVVHGTYNTVCSFGITAALVMEILSFALLIWAVRWVTVDATEPPGQQPTSWAVALAKPWPVRIAIAAASGLLLVAMALGSSRDVVMPDIMRAELPFVVRPYVDGVTIQTATDGTALAIPLTVRFHLDLKRQEIVGNFTNSGIKPLVKVIVTCRESSEDEDDDGKAIALGTIEPGKSEEIAEERGWTFAPGEQITIRAEGHAAQTLKLPRTVQ